MMLVKPKFWDKKNSIISYILFPLTLIYIFIIFLKKKFIKAQNFKIPVICVGNIYVGGTGKTPISVELANKLLKLKKRPAILRKYYVSHQDEYKFIKEKFTNLIIYKDRSNALKELEKSDTDIVILDDGLQDYKIRKDLNIVCFDQNQLIGNGMVFPSGPLRENLSSLKDAHIIIINGNRDLSFENKILDINNKLEIFYSSYEPTNLDQFKNSKLIALAGIGNPENFFQLLEKNNLKIKKKIVFPDHYVISKREIQIILNEARNEDCKVIMTEKDYYKIKDYNIGKVEYLKISLKINKLDILLNKIKKIYDKKI